jgi:glycosyltransferase involved in cell wall biosynthesis
VYSMIDSLLVSVIIPTYNSKRTIGCCLQSINKQTYPNIEIIVVDSDSNDGTRELAENFDAKVITIKVGRSGSRNIGVEKANGELILSLDSDMELTASVVEECIDRVNEGYDALIIPEISIGAGFWAECKALEKACYIGDELIEASRFFKRDVFERVAGYDSELEAGEDWDLNTRVRKAGYVIGRIRACIKHHEGRLSLWKTVTKKYYYGKTLEKYKRKHPTEAKQQLKLIRPAFLRNWRTLIRDPIHALGMLFMKTCEFGATGLGYFTGKRS